MNKKLTGYRKEMFEILIKSKKPLLAKDILNKMKDKPDVSTLYRGLDFLVKEKFIKHISFFDNTRLYFCSDSPHAHFLYCIKCQHAEEFDECFIHEFQSKITRQFEFKPIDHYLYFTGICKKCREELINY